MISNVNPVPDGKLPLGICKQSVMKLDSFITDMHEAKEDPDINDEQRELFTNLANMAATMQAYIVNLVSSEIGEEEFLNEDFAMDDIEEYPDFTGDIMDQSIEC